LDAGDVLFGGDGNDVVTGDNAEIVRVAPASGAADASSFTNKFTNRLTPVGAIVTTRWLRRLDLSVGPSNLLGDPEFERWPPPGTRRWGNHEVGPAHVSRPSAVDGELRYEAPLVEAPDPTSSAATGY
jgi:hypothetical protein